MPKHIETGKTKQRRKPLKNGWTKNILKSLGYSAMDVITEMMPNTASTISGIVETKSEVADTKNLAFDKAKELSEQMQSKLKTFREEDLRTAIDDIKSGKLHGRTKDFDFGDDDNLDFGGLDENFDFGEDDSSSVPNNVTVNVNVDEESPVVEAQVATANIISDGLKHSSELHKVGYASLATSIAKMSVGLSTKLDLVHSEVAKISTVVPKSLTEHAYLSAKYYEDSLGYQKQISETLTGIKELYTKSMKVVGEQNEEYRSPLSSFAYGIDISEYKDLVKKQIKNSANESMAGMMFNMFKDMYSTQQTAGDILGKTGFMETLTKSAMKNVIPSVMKQSGKQLDDLLQGLILSGGMKLGGLSKRWDSPLLKFIGDTFGIKTKPDLSVSKEKYEKGAVAFDGKVHRAITDVIPTYLRMITSALTGREEVTFDYEKGKFNTVRNIRENFKNELRRSATDQFFSETWDFNSIVDSLKDISAEQNKEIKESFQEFIYNMVKSGDFATFRKNGEQDDIAKFTGRTTDDPVVGLIREYFEGMIDQGRQNEVNEFFSSKTVRARQSLEEKHRSMTRDATTGNFNVINNGLTENDQNKIRATAEGGLMVDKYGRSSHSYLRDILGTLATGIKVVNVGTIEGNPSSILTYSNNILSQLSLDQNTLQANLVANAPSTQQTITQMSINMEEAVQNMADVLRQREYNDWLDDKAEYSDENKVSGKIFRRIKGHRDKIKQRTRNATNRISNVAIDAIYGKRQRPQTSGGDGSNDGGGSGGDGGGPNGNNDLENSTHTDDLPDLPPTPRVSNVLIGDFHNKLKTMGNDFVNDIIHPLSHALFNEEDGLITQIEETELDNDNKSKNVEDENSIKASAKATVKSIVTGNKNEDTGKYEKGLISDAVNDVNEIREKTKNWAQEMVYGSEDGSVKGINQYLRDFFGQREDGSLAVSEKAKEGFGAFKEHFKKRAYEWTDIIFGPEEEGEEKKLDIFLGDMKDKKGLIGASAVVGALGSFFLPGGPVGGALIGAGIGMASQSTQLKDFLFGETDDETGERVGGLITKEWQDYFKKIKKPMTIGAGVGLLGSFFLPGGPITGALIGAATNIAINTDRFKDFFFGKEDAETRKREGGVFGDIKQKINERFQETQDKLGLWIEENITNPLKVSMEPIKQRANQFLFGKDADGEDKGLIGKLADRLDQSVFGDLKRSIKENIIDKMKDGFHKLFGGFTNLLGTIIKSPFAAIRAYAEGVEKEDGTSNTVSFEERIQKLNEESRRKREERKAARLGQSSRTQNQTAPEADSNEGDETSRVLATVPDSVRETAEVAREQLDVTRSNHEETRGILTRIADAVTERMNRRRNQNGTDGDTAEVGDGAHVAAASGSLMGRHEYLDSINKNVKRILNSVDGQLNGAGWNLNRIYKLLRKRLKKDTGESDDEDGDDDAEGNGPFRRFYRLRDRLRGAKDKAVDAILAPFRLMKKGVESILTGIKGTVTAILGIPKMIWGAAKKLGPALLDAASGFVKGVGSVFSNGMKAIGNVMETASKGFGNLLAGAMNGLGSVLHGVGILGGEAVKLLAKGGTAAITGIAKGGAAIVKGAAGFASKLFHRGDKEKDKMEKHFILDGGTLDTVNTVNVVKMVGGVNTDQTTSTEDGGAKIIPFPRRNNAGDDISDDTSSDKPSVRDKLVAGMHRLKGYANGKVISVRDKASSILETAKDSAKSIKDDMKTKASSAWGTVKGKAGEIRDNLENKARTGAGFVKDKISSARQKIKDADVGGNLKNAAMYPFKLLQESANKVKDGLTKTVDTITNLPKKLLGLIPKAGKFLLNMGKGGIDFIKKLFGKDGQKVVVNGGHIDSIAGLQNIVPLIGGTIGDGARMAAATGGAIFGNMRQKGSNVIARVKNTASSIKAKFASEDANEKKTKFMEKITSLLTRNTETTEKHSSVWSSIFSKKGLITAGLILLSPLIFKAVKGIISFFSESGIGAKIADFLGGFGSAVGKDAAESLDQEGGISGIMNNASEQARAVTDLVGITNRKTHKLNPDGSLARDENGELMYDEAENRGLIGRVADFYMPVQTRFDPETGRAYTNHNYTHDTVARYDATIKVARKGAKLLKKGSKIVGKVAEGAKKLAGTSAGKAVASGVKTLGKGIGKAAKTGLEKVGGSDKVQTILKLGKKAINFLIEKVGAVIAKHGGNPGVVTKIGKQVIEKVLNGSTIGQYLGKFAKCFSKTAASAASFLASDTAFVIGGAVSGALNAAEMFEVNKEDVDWKMRAIAAAIEAVLNTSLCSWIDVIAEIFYSITGINLIGNIATAAYKAFSDDEDDAKLDEAKDKFNEQYEAHVAGEYEAYVQSEEANGNTPMSFEEFKGSDLATSKADYNTSENHFSITKTVSKAWNSAKNKVSDMVGNTVTVAKGFQESAKKGMEFVKNGLTKPIDGAKSLGSAVIKGWNFIGDMREKGTNAIKDIISGKKDVKSIVFSDLMKAWFDTEGGYYITNGDGTFNYYNANGEVMTENIDGEEVNAMIQKGLLVSDKIPSNANVSTAKAVIKGVQKSSTGIWGDMLNSAKTALKSFQEAAKKGWDYVKGLGEKAWNGFADLFNSDDEEESGGKGDDEPSPNSASGTVNGFSYYSQNDPSIRNKPFNLSNGESDTMGARGCGPTAMSMVASQLTGQNVDPVSMAKLATAGGYSTDVGTTPEYFQNAASSMGLKSQNIIPTKESIEASLRNGNPIILQGQDSREDSPFTSGGHYVVGVGMNGDNLVVNDPRGKQYSKEYDLNNVLGGVQNIWGFSKGQSSMENTVAPTILGMGGKSQGVSGDTLNNFPYFLQGDDRWGGTMYSSIGDASQTIGSSACGPTSMAMVLRSYGVDVTPVDTAQYALENGYRTANSGTSWGFFSSIGNKYGLTTTQLDSAQEAVNSLQDGVPVIASMGPSTFTKGGHYIVLSGINGEGKVIVNDPGKLARSNVTYDPSVFASEGKQFWSFSKDGEGSIDNVVDAGEVKVTTPREAVGAMVGNAMNTAITSIKKASPDTKITEGTPEGGTISESQAEDADGSNTASSNPTSILEFISGAASAFLSPIMDMLMGTNSSGESGDINTAVDGITGVTQNLIGASTAGAASSNRSSSAGVNTASSGLSYVRNGDYLGKYTAQFESGDKGPTAISTGTGDYGGVSFGTYQFATQNASEVGANSELAKFWNANYAANHPGVVPGNNQAFKDAWLYEANADMKGFQNRETAFMADNYYQPQVSKISDIVNPDSYDRGLQEDIYATSIQFGPYTGVVKNALEGKDVSSMDPKDVINAIQDYKVANNASLFASSSQKIRDAAKKRHDVTERKVMLELAGKPPINPTEVAQEDLANDAKTLATNTASAVSSVGNTISKVSSMATSSNDTAQGGFGDGPKVIRSKGPRPLIGGKGGENNGSSTITDSAPRGISTFTPSVQTSTRSVQPTVASKAAGNVLLNKVIELLGYIVENTSGINTGVQELYNKDFGGSSMQVIENGGNNSIIPLSKESDSVDPRSTFQYKTAKRMSAGTYLD